MKLPSRSLLTTLLLAAALAAPALPGCGWLAGMSERAVGKSVVAEYHGLENKSLAIVVYADQATTDEFPAAREEISAFVANQIRLNMPNTRLLHTKEVINWQDDTINWFGLSEKQIGAHFSVDRVLYIEVLTYSGHMEKAYGDLQGHIRASCKIFEVDGPGNDPAWSTIMDVTWPLDRPLDPNLVSEVAVRKRTLEIFSEDLIDKLYDHQQFDKPMSERH